MLHRHREESLARGHVFHGDSFAESISLLRHRADGMAASVRCRHGEIARLANGMATSSYKQIAFSALESDCGPCGRMEAPQQTAEPPQRSAIRSPVSPPYRGRTASIGIQAGSSWPTISLQRHLEVLGLPQYSLLQLSLIHI